ncbi:MAG TPA: hypothetical protein VKG01_10945 [Thermoanaerobaculia bacterium]|nr:hypothetical protein [Thermoanaerobaculia bacterium]
MIAFASLFLGLVVGVVPVTVLVEKPVAAVRVELDGKTVGRVAQAPWTLPLDFGSEPLPHELVARALDESGKEIAVARQFVNLPRPPAEVEVVLERDDKGKAVAARFSGLSLIAVRPAKVLATFDGSPLTVDSTRIAIPDHDPDARHLLTVELEFAPAVRSRTDVVFGGVAASVVRSELTAVAVRSPAGRNLEVPELGDALLRNGKPVRVVAVEQGSALICVVRGPSVALALRSLGTGGKTTLLRQPDGRRLPQFDRDASRYEISFEKEDTIRFIWPMPRTLENSPGAQLFDRSRDFPGFDGGMAWLLTRVEHPQQHPREIRLADAAAVAGLEATAAGQRRAVILVLGDEKSDDSRHSPDAVRRYLAALRVPLYVWSLKSLPTQPLAKGWGEVEDVSATTRLDAAMAKVKADLASQRILWVEGRALPQEITLAQNAAGLELAK